MMEYLERTRSFFSDESGAVTVDWVALTATVVLIGIGVGVSVGTSSKGLADSVSTNIDARGVWTY